MRRLAIALIMTPLAGLAGLSLLAPTAAAEGRTVPPTDPTTTNGGTAEDVASGLAPVDVLEVSGLVDDVTVDSIIDAIAKAEADGSQALILQMNTGGAIVDEARMVELIHAVRDAEVGIGLWVGPWLSQVYGLPLGARGRMTLILAVAQIAGLFFWGASDRWFASYRRPALASIMLALATLATGALVVLPAAALPAFMAAFGFFFGATPLLTAHGKSLFPRELTGRGMTLINTGVIGGAFAQQAFTGFVIEAFGSKIVEGVRTYPPEAFRLVFGLLAVQLAIAGFFYLRAPDPHPERA